MADLWSFVPMPDLREQYSWRTDVRAAPDGEIRDALHDGQRILTYDYVCEGHSSQAELMVRADAGAVWEVPIWSEAEKLGPIAATDTVIAAGQHAGYSGRAMVRQGGHSLVVDVEQNGAHLNLSAPIGFSMSSPLIAPVVKAFVPNGASLVKRRGGRVRAVVDFLVQETGWWPHSGFSSYLGLDYWPCAGVAINQLSGSVGRAVEVIDAGMGVQSLELTQSYTRARYSAEVVSTDPAAIWAMKRWLYHLKGRDRAFWAPAWGGNVRTVAEVGVGGTVLAIPAADHTPEQFAGQHVALGGGQFRQITSASRQGAVINLTVAPLTAAANRLKVIRKMRLDADVVDIRHRRGFSSQFSVPLLEVVA